MGELDADRGAPIRRHIDRCVSCQTAVAQLLLGSEGSPSFATRRDWIGQTIEGRYTIVRCVGIGASAVVYQAADQRLERDVALKVMLARHPVEAETLRRRLLAESKAMAGLRHPNIVTVFDVFENEGHTVVVMELVVGETFREWMRDASRTTPQILDALSQAGQGLAHAHREGWIHRDFKPENILVGADGRVLVTDFGLAKLGPTVATIETRDSEPALFPTDSALRTLSVVGTPAYMAPEQWAGRPVDARADLFAFGVTLYEALYGKRPFEATAAEELQWLKLAGGVQFPTQSKVAARLIQLMEHLLQPDPQQRPATMNVALTGLNARKRGRRWLLPAVLGLTTLSVVALSPWGPVPQDECSTATSQALWDAETREAAAALWQDDGGWVLLDAALASYAQRWTDAWASVCEAESDADSSALRRACLKEQLSWVASTVDLLLEERVLPQLAMSAIPATSVCEGPGIVPIRQVPTDPIQVEVHRELRADLFGLWALALDRECGEALERAPSLVARADAIDASWVLAEIQFLIGECSIVLGRLDPAKSALVRAAELANNSGHVGVATEAWMRMATVSVLNDADADAAREYAALAQGALESLGEAPSAQLLRAKLAATRSSIARTERDFEAAERLAIESIRLAQQYGPLQVASFREDLALAYSETGRPKEAVAILRDVEALYRKHGDVDVLALNTVQLNLGGTLFDLGQLDEAERYTRLAIESGLTLEGGEGMASVAPRLNLVQILLTAQKTSEAADELTALEAAFESMEAVRETDRVSAAQFGVQLAWGRSDWAGCVELGRSTVELPSFERASASGVNTTTLLASCLQRVGRPEGALDASRSLLEALEGSALPPAFFVLAEQAAARALLDLDRASEAQALLERAQGRLENAEDTFALLPTLHVDLARSLWAIGKTSEARRLATQAFAELQAQPDEESSETLRSWAGERGIALTAID